MGNGRGQDLADIVPDKVFTLLTFNPFGGSVEVDHQERVAVIGRFQEHDAAAHSIEQLTKTRFTAGQCFPGFLQGIQIADHQEQVRG